MSVEALGPIDIDSPPTTRWALLSKLKTRTIVVAIADLGPQEKNVHNERAYQNLLSGGRGRSRVGGMWDPR